MNNSRDRQTGSKTFRHNNLKVLQVHNRHRGFGGSDNAWDATIAMLRSRGFEFKEFSRDSRAIPSGLRGKVKAALTGIYSRDAVRAFARQLVSYKPDLVHAHELLPMISPWILKECTRAGIPVVLSCYDFLMTCPIATHSHNGKICHKCLDGKAYHAVLNNCRNNHAESIAYSLRSAVATRFRLRTEHVSHFIAPSEFSQKWMQEKQGLDKEFITVNFPIIPLAQLSVDASKGGYVAYVGRFVPEKGIDLLIEATRKLGLPLKLAGKESNHPAIKAGDDVECVLTDSREELDAFYRGAKMLVVPSTWYETFSIVAAEAMSHGVPVIASRIGALPYTVKDGISGLIFETGNCFDLANKINRLWNDDKLCRALGTAGRKQVGQLYSEDAHFENIMHAYEKAMDPSRSSSTHMNFTTEKNENRL